jgi:Xaa-Pro aminopeptidase
MYTMHPVIVSGSYRWDQDLLPLDEFEERLRELRRNMEANGWAGLIVHGDSQESAMLTWLTNFYPRLRWAIAMIGLEGAPELLVAGGTRDLPAASSLTWCRSFESYGDAPRLLAGWLERTMGRVSGSTSRTIAVHGLNSMRDAVRRTILKSVEQAKVQAIEADSLLDRLLVSKRWRELRVVREAHGILAGAVDALQQQWSRGECIKTGIIETERFARLAQAQDVRILFSLDGGATLRPFEDMSTELSESLVCFVAVRYLGYWAQAYVTRGIESSAVFQATAATLRSLRDVTGPGVSGAGLAAAARPHMVGFDAHPMMSGQFGHGVGLNLAEPPFFTQQTNETMQEGGVYTLQAGLIDAQSTGALLSATICIVDGKVEDLYVPNWPTQANTCKKGEEK